VSGVLRDGRRFCRLFPAWELFDHATVGISHYARLMVARNEQLSELVKLNPQMICNTSVDRSVVKVCLAKKVTLVAPDGSPVVHILRDNTFVTKNDVKQAHTALAVAKIRSTKSRFFGHSGVDPACDGVRKESTTRFSTFNIPSSKRDGFLNCIKRIRLLHQTWEFGACYRFASDKAITVLLDDYRAYLIQISERRNKTPAARNHSYAMWLSSSKVRVEFARLGAFLGDRYFKHVFNLALLSDVEKSSFFIQRQGWLGGVVTGAAIVFSAGGLYVGSQKVYHKFTKLVKPVVNFLTSVEQVGGTVGTFVNPFVSFLRVVYDWFQKAWAYIEPYFLYFKFVWNVVKYFLFIYAAVYFFRKVFPSMFGSNQALFWLGVGEILGIVIVYKNPSLWKYFMPDVVSGGAVAMNISRQVDESSGFTLGDLFDIGTRVVPGRVKNFTMGLGEALPKFTRFGQAVEWVLSRSKTIIAWGYTYFTGDPYPVTGEERDLMLCYETIRTFDVRRRAVGQWVNLFQEDYLLVDELDLLCADYKVHRKFLPSRSKNISPVIVTQFNKTLSIVEECMAAIQLYKHTSIDRSLPVWLHFFGVPNTGKSDCIGRVGAATKAGVFYYTGDIAYAGPWTNHDIFYMPMDEAYFDAYQRQKYMAVDDLFQVLGSEHRVIISGFLMNFMSSCPCYMRVADLELKGKVSAGSDFFFTSANALTFNTLGIEKPDALHDRITLAVQVEIHEHTKECAEGCHAINDYTVVSASKERSHMFINGREVSRLTEEQLVNVVVQMHLANRKTKIRPKIPFVPMQFDFKYAAVRSSYDVDGVAMVPNPIVQQMEDGAEPTLLESRVRSEMEAKYGSRSSFVESFEEDKEHTPEFLRLVNALHNDGVDSENKVSFAHKVKALFPPWSYGPKNAVLSAKRYVQSLSPAHWFLKSRSYAKVALSGVFASQKWPGMDDFVHYSTDMLCFADLWPSWHNSQLEEYRTGVLFASGDSPTDEMEDDFKSRLRFCQLLRSAVYVVGLFSIGLVAFKAFEKSFSPEQQVSTGGHSQPTGGIIDPSEDPHVKLRVGGCRNGKGHRQLRGGKREIRLHSEVVVPEVDLQAESFVDVAAGLEIAIRGNIVHSTFGDRKCWVLGICGNVCVTTSHCIDDLAEDAVVRLNVSLQGSLYELRWGQITPIFVSDVEDLVFLVLPKGVINFRDIRCHFTDARTTDVTVRRIVPTVTLHKDKPVCQLVVNSTDVWKLYTDKEKVEIIAELGIDGELSNMPNKPGFCGLPYYTLKSKLNPHILGIHGAGDKASDVSYFHSITLNMCNDAVNAANIHKILEPSILDRFPVLQSNCQPFTPGTRASGVFDTVQAHVANDTRLEMTQFHPDHAKYDVVWTMGHVPTRVPARFKNPGGEAPLSKTLDKYSKIKGTLMVTGPIDDWLLEKHNFSELLPDTYDVGKVRLLTFEEAVVGGENTTPVDLTKSPGYPYIAMGMKRHQVLFKGDREINPIFRSEVELLREQLKTLVVPMVVVDSLKDELISIEDCAKLKVRLFCIGELTYFVLCRMYFEKMFKEMEAKPYSTPLSIGINPHSMQWGLLHSRLSEVGDNVMAGDFSGFEFTIPGQLVEMFIEFCDFAYPLAEPDRSVRANLVRSVMKVWHVLMKRVYKVEKGNSSGNALTAFINSIFNWGLHKMFWRYMGYTEDEWRKDVRSALYGDDSKVHVRGHPEFNMLSFRDFCAAIGMRYNTCTKGEITLPYISTAECDYLKRRFVMRDGFCYAPLSLSSILEIPMWAWKGCDNPKRDMANCWRSVCIELRHYDSGLYTRARGIALWWARNFDVELHIDPYSDALKKLSNMGAGEFRFDENQTERL